MIVLVCCLGL